MAPEWRETARNLIFLLISAEKRKKGSTTDRRFLGGKKSSFKLELFLRFYCEIPAKFTPKLPKKCKKCTKSAPRQGRSNTGTKQTKKHSILTPPVRLGASQRGVVFRAEDASKIGGLFGGLFLQNYAKMRPPRRGNRPRGHN